MLTGETMKWNAGPLQGWQGAQTQPDKALGDERVSGGHSSPLSSAYLLRLRSILHGSSSMYFFSSKTRLITGFRTSCR